MYIKKLYLHFQIYRLSVYFIMVKYICSFLIMLIFSSCKEQVVENQAYEYQGLLLPSLEREWTAKDFIETVSSLADSDKISDKNIPGFNNQGKKLFEKIISDENLLFFQDMKTSPDEKLQTSSKIIPAYLQLISKYNLSFKKSYFFQSELVELNYTILKITSQTLNLINNYKQSFSAKDFAEFENNLKPFIIGSISIVTNRNLTAHVAKKHAKNMLNIIPNIAINLSNNSAKEIKIAVNNSLQKTEKKAIQEKLMTLVNRLEHIIN